MSNENCKVEDKNFGKKSDFLEFYQMSKIYPENDNQTEEDFWVLRSVSVTIHEEPENLSVSPSVIVPKRTPKFQIFKPKPPPPVKAKPKEKLQTIEQELNYYLPGVFTVRLQDRYVLLKDEKSVLDFKELQEHKTLNPSKTFSDVWLEFKSMPNIDAYLRVLFNDCLDSYISYKRFDFFSFSKSVETYRYVFMQKLIAQDLVLLINNGDSDRKREIYVICPFERLLIEAEMIKFKMPLSKAQISKHIKNYDKKIPPINDRLYRLSATYQYERAALEKRSSNFERARIQDFLNGSEKNANTLADVFFTDGQKNILLQSIINGISIRYDKALTVAPVLTNSSTPDVKPETDAADFKKHWHISDLLLKGLFTKYQPLHSKNLSILQKQLASSRFSLPIRNIRDYFGEEVAFYFAFLQFYAEWCFWICIPGMISIILSFVSSSSLDGSLSSILSFFDNSYAILFASSLNIFSLLFLKFWKRRNHYLSFLWDVDYVQLADSSRIGWKSSSILAYSPITGEMIPYESKKTILLRKSVSFFFLSICIMFLIFVVGINVGIQSYLANNSSLGIAFFDNLGPLGISAGTSVIAAVAIIILEFAIDKFSLFLIELENHQTISAHLDRYIWIQFVIQFINSFGLMIFLSVIKPVISQTSPEFSYFFGPLRCSSQGSGSTCMQALVLSVAIIFVIQQFSILAFSYLFLIVTRRSLKAGQFPNYIDKIMTAITHESFQKEYSSRILQFGTIVLFTSTFPLAPFLALLNNAIHSSLSTHQYLTIYMRPFAVQSNGIGPWESIAKVLVYLGILVNAICIPFLSDGFIIAIKTLGIYTPDTAILPIQVIFIISYENLLLLIGYAIDIFIDDVPHSVKVGRLAEKHIHLQRLKTESL